MDTHQTTCDELHYSETYYRALVELAVDGILLGDRDGVIIDANEAMCGIFGLPRNKLVGRHISKLPFSAESLREKPFRFDLVQGGKTVVAERVVIRPDTTQVTIEMRSRMVSDGSMHCFARDITDRRREEMALRESENRYRQLFGLESDAIFLIDNVDGQIIEANDAAAALYGYSHDELASLRNVDLWAEPEAPQAATLGAPVMRGGIIIIPLRYHRKADRSVFPVEITARSFMQGGRSVHVAAVRDITSRKQSEDELRKSEERFRHLAETLEIRVASRTKELEVVNVSLAHNVVQLRKLAMELTQTEERERKRLALALHDHLQPLLVAATMKVSLLDQPASDKEKLRTIKEALDMIKSAINASRALTTDLYPPILLDAGLMPGLRWLALWIKDQYGLTVELKGGELLEVSETLGILLFQTARELLFNVVKHAKSDLASVAITHIDENRLQMVIEDQGIGIPENRRGVSVLSGGLGLFHFRERLESIGGTLEVLSGEGQGTRIVVTVPLARESSDLDPGLEEAL